MSATLRGVCCCGGPCCTAERPCYLSGEEPLDFAGDMIVSIREGATSTLVSHSLTSRTVPMSPGGDCFASSGSYSQYSSEPGPLTDELVERERGISSQTIVVDGAPGVRWFGNAFVRLRRNIALIGGNGMLVDIVLGINWAVDMLPGVEPCLTVTGQATITLAGVLVTSPPTIRTAAITASLVRSGECVTGISIGISPIAELVTAGTTSFTCTATAGFVVSFDRITDCAAGAVGAGCLVACCKGGSCTQKTIDQCITDGGSVRGVRPCGSQVCATQPPASPTPICCDTKCAINQATITYEWYYKVEVMTLGCCPPPAAGTPTEGPWTTAVEAFVTRTASTGAANNCNDVGDSLPAFNVVIPAHGCVAARTMQFTLSAFFGCGSFGPGSTGAAISLTGVDLTSGLYDVDGSHTSGSANYASGSGILEPEAGRFACPNPPGITNYPRLRVRYTMTVEVVGRSPCR